MHQTPSPGKRRRRRPTFKSRSQAERRLQFRRIAILSLVAAVVGGALIWYDDATRDPEVASEQGEAQMTPVALLTTPRAPKAPAVKPKPKHDTRPELPTAQAEAEPVYLNWCSSSSSSCV